MAGHEHASADESASLLALVQARVDAEGRTDTPLPELWLNRADAPRAIARDRTNTMQLGVVVQGRKRVRAGALELLYDPLSYLVLRGETLHQGTILEATPERPYLSIGLSLSPQLVAQALLDIVAAGHSPSEGPAPPAFVSPFDASLVGGMCRLLRTLDDPIERRVIAPLVIREIVYRLLLTNAAVVLCDGLFSLSEGERVRRAMTYIEDNLHRRLTVEGIARRVAMSPSHFAHRFRAIASVSPMRYQKLLRMERARELLLGGGERASVIATRIGYASDAHFTRDFKRHFGLAPASYVRAFARSRGVEPSVSASGAALRRIAGSSKKSAGAALG